MCIALWANYEELTIALVDVSFLAERKAISCHGACSRCGNRRLMMTPAACEYLWWLSVSVKLRIMTRGEVETINEPDRGHLRISLLIVLGDLAFRVRRTGYVWGGKVWIEVYDADSLKSMNRTRVCCKTQARASTAAKAIIKAISKEIQLQAKYERCR
jgi:hypothetical protein